MSWRAVLAVTLALGLATQASAADRRKRPEIRFASPAKAIAAEIAFVQLVQRKGAVAAVRETAAKDAVMFLGRPVNVRDWIKRQKEPVPAIAWQPHQTWLSCDGSLAVNTGAWQSPEGRFGYFTTFWARQSKGGYKWVMLQGGALESPLEQPEMIGSSLAHCGQLPPMEQVAASALNSWQGGTSADRSLTWSVRINPRCGRSLSVALRRRDGTMETVLNREVSPPPIPPTTDAASRPAVKCAAA